MNPMSMKLTWRQKLAGDGTLPKTGTITGKMSTRWGSGTMVVPAPFEVDEIMKTVPKGKLITISEIRARLAKRHGVDVCCPITTGIFAWIAAHAAEEEAAAGRKRITPYWRTLKTGGVINEKYPGGASAIQTRLAAEGHRVVRKGKHLRVEDFEKALIAP